MIIVILKNCVNADAKPGVRLVSALFSYEKKPTTQYQNTTLNGLMTDWG